jgi:hypothetical protein
MQGSRVANRLPGGRHQRRRGKTSASGRTAAWFCPFATPVAALGSSSLRPPAPVLAHFPPPLQEQVHWGPAEACILIHLAWNRRSSSWLERKSNRFCALSALRWHRARRSPLARGPVARARGCRNSGATRVGHGILGPNGVIFPMPLALMRWKGPMGVSVRMACLKTQVLQRTV